MTASTPATNSTVNPQFAQVVSKGASLGVQDYWIVNLVEERLEVRRQPIARPTARFGFDYASTQILTRGQNASPLIAPNVVLEVDDLMP